MKVLIEQIKIDQVTARKGHNALEASLLTTLIGEASMIGKNDGGREVTDAELVAVIKKFIKGMDDTLKYLGDGNPDATATVHAEKMILGKYLPKQMSHEELEDALKLIVLDVGQNMGKIMGALKARYDGQYDGKMASQIVKGIL